MTPPRGANASTPLKTRAFGDVSPACACGRWSIPPPNSFVVRVKRPGPQPIAATIRGLRRHSAAKAPTRSRGRDVHQLALKRTGELYAELSRFGMKMAALRVGRGRANQRTESFTMRLFDLKKQHAHALNNAEAIVQAAKNAGREMTTTEQADFDTAMTAAKALEPKVELDSINEHDESVFQPGRCAPPGRRLGKPRKSRH